MKLHRTVFWPMLLLGLSLIIPEEAFAYYDPGVQRWLNRDPIGEPGFEAERKVSLVEPKASVASAEAKQGPNLYCFVANKPVSNHDPDGLITGVVPCPFFMQAGCTESCRRDGFDVGACVVTITLRPDGIVHFRIVCICCKFGRN